MVRSDVYHDRGCGSEAETIESGGSEFYFNIEYSQPPVSSPTVKGNNVAVGMVKQEGFLAVGGEESQHSHNFALKNCNRKVVSMPQSENATASTSISITGIAVSAITTSITTSSEDRTWRHQYPNG
jgi:hypothetical protein